MIKIKPPFKILQKSKTFCPNLPYAQIASFAFFRASFNPRFRGSQVYKIRDFNSCGSRVILTKSRLFLFFLKIILKILQKQCVYIEKIVHLQSKFRSL